MPHRFPTPESYIYLLTLQCIVSLCEGFVSFSGPIYTSLVVQRPRTAGEPAIRAPPALDLDLLPQDDPQVQHLHIVKAIVSQSWPALLAALSFVISTNLSDELFVEVLGSYQAMTNVSGMLGLSTPRDAFFNSLSKFAVPTTVVSTLEAWVENPPVSTPRSATAAITEGLGLSGPFQPPALSERNLACLKAFVACALFLAGSLGESWYGVLDTLQSADGVLVLMTRTGTPAKKGLFGVGTGPATGSGQARSASFVASHSQSAVGASSTNGGTTYRHPLLADLEVETVLTAIQRLFDASKNLEDTALKDFVDALCKLSAEVVGMQASDLANQVDRSDNDENGGGLLTVNMNQSQESVVHRRRVSGIYIPKNLVRLLAYTVSFLFLTTTSFCITSKSPGTLESPSWVELHCSISIALSIVLQTSRGTRLPVIFLWSFDNHTPPKPYVFKPLDCWMRSSLLYLAIYPMLATYRLKSNVEYWMSYRNRSS